METETSRTDVCKPVPMTDPDDIIIGHVDIGGNPKNLTGNMSASLGGSQFTVDVI
jgi:hypothetical protein